MIRNTHLTKREDESTVYYMYYIYYVSKISKFHLNRSRKEITLKDIRNQGNLRLKEVSVDRIFKCDRFQVKSHLMSLKCVYCI